MPAADRQLFQRNHRNREQLRVSAPVSGRLLPEIRQASQSDPDPPDQSGQITSNSRPPERSAMTVRRL
jgi:hypothetical protein